MIQPSTSEKMAPGRRCTGARIRTTWFAAALATAVCAPASSTRAGTTYAYGQVYGGGTVTARRLTCRSGRLHNAMDIAAPCGRGMRAMIYGKRYYRYRHDWHNECGGSTGSGSYGNWFYYTGRNSYRFVEAHSNHSSTYGRSGYFYKGSILNLVGSSGNSSGPHTHAENKKDWSPITGWLVSYYYYGLCGHHPTYRTRVGVPRNS